MSVFSFVLIGIIVFILFLKKESIKKKYVSLFTLTVVLEVNRISGCFVTIIEKEVDYSDIALFTTSVFAIIYLFFNTKVDKKRFFISIALVVCVCVGVIHTFLEVSEVKTIVYGISWDHFAYGFEEKVPITITIQTFLMITRLFLFLLNSFVVMKFEKDDIEKVLKICLTTFKIHIGYILIEFMLSRLLQLNVMYQVRDFFFGKNISATIGHFRGDTFTLLGWTREPSHCAEVLFLFVLICVLTKNLKKQKIWVILAISFMFSTGAFTALLYVACLMVLFVIAYEVDLKNRKMIILSVFLLIGVVIAGYSILSNDYYLGRITDFFDELEYIFSNEYDISRGLITSSRVRLASIIENLNLMFLRPLFGWGIGTAYAHSGLASVLSNIGLLGTFFWIYYCLNFIDHSVQRNKKLYFFVVVIAPNFICGNLGVLYSLYVLLLLSFIKKSTLNIEKSDLVSGCDVI